MLLFFTNLSVMEFQVRYLALFLLFSVIDGCEWFKMVSLVIRDLICGNNLSWFLSLNLIYETLWLSDFNAGKTQLVSFDRSNNTGSIDVKMDGSVLDENSSFQMLGLTFSSKLVWGSYMISIAKTASKKIGVLICSMKFLTPEFA